MDPNMKFEKPDQDAVTAANDCNEAIKDWRLKAAVATGQSESTVATGQSESSSSCSVHKKCVAAGLTGECCPTIDGVTLDCCDKPPPDEKSCASHSACVTAGLTGQCCPTKDGVTLDCCK